ncbi:GTPase HflX [Aminiphilus circumscriptus]|uniref:GTPase HflX n=1 Tax=Aminiphilus circumscriptus TaxID=290732 RepID=UPI0004927D41|nr:GTPase HflX [Aminiphilus circumscriptus]
MPEDSSLSKRRALTVFLERPGEEDLRVLLEKELQLLLENVGISVVGTVVQRRAAPDPAFFIGQGKAEEAALMARSLDAGVLVFDDALTPGQVLNLKKRTGLEIQDRPGVIVTIFQARAHTAEAKLQVELARCRYEVPLLKGLGQQMSRTGGGIGTRGPGETEFERHRRKLERRIRDIDKKLQVVRQRREYQRKRRSRSGFPTVALVGYTNSGKSTLLRTLSGDGSILARDQLFSTLDTAVRRVTLPGGREILMADTVGFIRKLPPALVAAFRATLEEVASADLVLLVLEVASPDVTETLQTVQQMLFDIGAGTVPRILVLNKVDLVDSVFLERIQERLVGAGETVVSVSALRGDGLDVLLRRIAARLNEKPWEESV